MAKFKKKSLKRSKVSKASPTPKTISPLKAKTQKKKVSSMVSPKVKTGLKIAGAVVGAGALAYGVGKVAKKVFGTTKRKGTISKLRNKVMKVKLKIELLKSQRRLQKEMMKI